MSTLSETDVMALLQARHGWTLVDGEITRTVQLASFPAAILFVAAVGQLAEAADHHPNIDVRYRQVKLTLSTHSAGGLTDKDFELAEKIDGLLP